jgi:hypothetical protein
MPSLRSVSGLAPEVSLLGTRREIRDLDARDERTLGGAIRMSKARGDR